MNKSSGFIFEGAIELAADTVSGGNFSRLSLKAEASEGNPKWDLKGPDTVDGTSRPNEPIARSGKIEVFRLDPEAFDEGEIKDGETNSKVLLLKVEFPLFTGFVRESSLFVRGGMRFGSGLVAIIQRHPRIWISEGFVFCAKFMLDMRG